MIETKSLTLSDVLRDIADNIEGAKLELEEKKLLVRLLCGAIEATESLLSTEIKKKTRKKLKGELDRFISIRDKFFRGGIF